MIVSSHCSVAAKVKKREPTKKVAPSARAPTQARYAGSGATTKQAEPRMNSTAIHQEARCGAHKALSRPPETLERRDACLRCRREDHSILRPSGCS